MYIYVYLCDLCTCIYVYLCVCICGVVCEHLYIFINISTTSDPRAPLQPSS